ncbi:MAG: hypothetical protein IPH35_25760 [Rhodoferax sp.]|nr:hypothetical protein [Rhodoferax sp.]
MSAKAMGVAGLAFKESVVGNSLSFDGSKIGSSLPAAADYGELRSPQGARTSGNAPLVSADSCAGFTSSRGGSKSPALGFLGRP